MKLKGQKKKIPVLILHLGLKMKPLKMAYQNRRLPGAIDVIGQTITISRVEGRRRANENSNIQVLSERCAAEVDNNFSKPPPFFPPGGPPTHLPPPPFLPPPPTVSTAPPLIPPPVSGLKSVLPDNEESHCHSLLVWFCVEYIFFHPCTFSLSVSTNQIEKVRERDREKGLPSVGLPHKWLLWLALR
ncbi:uncharacterized protein LOC133773571 isoform X4 [Lepus europaeus]|uniref:uncharacterized protein LOC133773571 isoform X4 n=1 Tax=Lepus europaeus TaxID=9983 RepID=UPI002B46470F|nr:uncharacterized protein LOC133773571 isoform X4 [Lepus europaeus]